MNYVSLRGVIHGNAIELERDDGLADGEKVEVIVRPVGATTSQPGEGLLRTEGALADDFEWDAIMEEIQRDRNREPRPQS